MQDFKSRALAAVDNLNAMHEVADMIRHSPDASPTQIAAAAAAWRSVHSSMQFSTPTRIQVARMRFQKMIEML